MKICEQVTYCERLPGSLLGSGESQTGQGSSQERVEFHLWKLGQGPANYGLGVQGWPTTHVLWSMSYKWLWIFKCEAPQPHLIFVSTCTAYSSYIRPFEKKSTASWAVWGPCLDPGLGHSL